MCSPGHGVRCHQRLKQLPRDVPNRNHRVPQCAIDSPTCAVLSRCAAAICRRRISIKDFCSGISTSELTLDDSQRLSQSQRTRPQQQQQQQIQEQEQKTAAGTEAQLQQQEFRGRVQASTNEVPRKKQEPHRERTKTTIFESSTKIPTPACSNQQHQRRNRQRTEEAKNSLLLDHCCKRPRRDSESPTGLLRPQDKLRSASTIVDGASSDVRNFGTGSATVHFDVDVDENADERRPTRGLPQLPNNYNSTNKQRFDRCETAVKSFRSQNARRPKRFLTTSVDLPHLYKPTPKKKNRNKNTTHNKPNSLNCSTAAAAAASAARISRTTNSGGLRLSGRVAHHLPGSSTTDSSKLKLLRLKRCAGSTHRIASQRINSRNHQSLLPSCSLRLSLKAAASAQRESAATGEGSSRRTSSFEASKQQRVPRGCFRRLGLGSDVDDFSTLSTSTNSSSSSNSSTSISSPLYSSTVSSFRLLSSRPPLEVFSLSSSLSAAFPLPGAFAKLPQVTSVLPRAPSPTAAASTAASFNY